MKLKRSMLSIRQSIRMNMLVSTIWFPSSSPLIASAEYTHLNRRARQFPWGPNSLFFNPHVSIARVLQTLTNGISQTQKDMSEAAS
jgi:hypothetical protein